MLKLYRAVLARIVELKKGWGNPGIMEKLEHSIFRRTTLHQRDLLLQHLKDKDKYRTNTNTGKEKVLYCLEFNRGKCWEKSSSHDTKIKGNPYVVQHICKMCWIKDASKRAHPEGDSSCPNKA